MSSLPPLSGGPGAGLGNLAQAAREKHLKQARSTLIIIGILTAAINGFQLSTVESEVQKLVQTQQIPPDAAATVIGVARLILGGTVGLGILFVVLGLLVRKFPVPATVLGLVLYVAAAAGFALLDPMTLAQGAIFKIIITVGLVKAVQAAIAYQRETREAQAFSKPAAVAPGAEF